MKKILIGLAAGALAVVATGAGSASAAGTSVYDQIVDASPVGETLIDASGLASTLDDCGNDGNNNGLPDYTVFFPNSDAIFGYVLDALGMSIGELAAQPALVKQVLLYHVHKGNISPTQLADGSNTTWNTMGGLTLVKTTNIESTLLFDPFGFTDLEAIVEDQSGGTNISAAINTVLGAKDKEINTGALVEIAAAPTALTFSINGYEITNVAATLTYDVDYETLYESGITDDEFEEVVQDGAAAAATVIGAAISGSGPSGATITVAEAALIAEAIEEFYSDAAALLDTSDDMPSLDELDVTDVVQACNGYVYYIKGLLSPSSAALTQGTNTTGEGAAASGDALPATGSESMALTYAALASLIAGAGVLVLRRRSVA